MSIQEISSNIKRYLAVDEFFYTAVILLVAVVAFGLGRMSGGEIETQTASLLKSEPQAVTVTQEAPVVESTAVPGGVGEGNYVASRNGTKYHLPWCPGAQQIKDENKVWFDTKEAAETAGYTPAANCKGL